LRREGETKKTKRDDTVSTGEPNKWWRGGRSQKKSYGKKKSETGRTIFGTQESHPTLSRSSSEKKVSERHKTKMREENEKGSVGQSRTRTRLGCRGADKEGRKGIFSEGNDRSESLEDITRGKRYLARNSGGTEDRRNKCEKNSYEIGPKRLDPLGGGVRIIV